MNEKVYIRPKKKIFEKQNKHDSRIFKLGLYLGEISVHTQFN